MNNQATLNYFLSTYAVAVKESKATEWIEQNITSTLPITQRRHTLTSLYSQVGVAKTIIETPVRDALAGGITIKTNAEDATEEQLENQIDKILKTVQDLFIVARVFGGAVLLVDEGIEVKEKKKDENREGFISRMQTELKITENSDITYHIIDPWKASNQTYSKISQDTNINSIEKQGELNHSATLQDITINTFGIDIHLEKVHKSRIKIIRNGLLIGNEYYTYRGWGRSELEHCKVEIANYLRTSAAVQKGLDANGTLIHTTSNTVNEQAESAKNVNGLGNAIKTASLIQIPEGDTITAVQVPQNVKEPVEQKMSALSSAVPMPMKKLFGLQAVGMSNDDSSLENYYRILKGLRQELKPVILQLLKYELQTTKDYASIVDSLDIAFKEELVKQDLQQLHTVKRNKIQDLINLFEKGLIDNEKIMNMIDKLEYFPTSFTEE